MTKATEREAELYRLAQAQTLIDLCANGTPTAKEWAKHHTKDGNVIPTAEAYEKVAPRTVSVPYRFKEVTKGKKSR
jgi:hypothetical protein